MQPLDAGEIGEQHAGNQSTPPLLGPRSRGWNVQELSDGSIELLDSKGRRGAFADATTTSNVALVDRPDAHGGMPDGQVRVAYLRDLDEPKVLVEHSCERRCCHVDENVIAA